MRTTPSARYFYTVSTKYYAALVILLTMFTNFSRADTCTSCNKNLVNLSTVNKNLGSFTNLLKLNENYLAKYGSHDPSKAIKTKSNILVITVRIEALKLQATKLRQDITQKGCDSCSPIVQ